MSARTEPQPCAVCKHTPETPEGTTNWGTGTWPYFLCSDRDACGGRLVTKAAQVSAKPKPVRKPRTGSRSRKTAAAGEAT